MIKTLIITTLLAISPFATFPQSRVIHTTEHAGFRRQPATLGLLFLEGHIMLMFSTS